MSKVLVDTIDTRSGTSTMQIGSTNTSTINLGVSGDTVNIPSGVTIANAGTATGFGSEFAVTQYTARLQQAASQSLSNASWTKLTLGTQVFDKGSIADESNSKITIPSGAGGLWLFRGVTRGDDIRANRLIISFYKNGSTMDGTTAGDTGEISTKGSDGYTGALMSTFGYLNLSASDYIELYAYQNEGGSENVSQSSLNCVYLGAI